MRTGLSALGGAALAATLAFFPATATAHGGDPDDQAAAIAKAMKSPLMARGSTRIEIVHVTKACHVWRQGAKTAAGLKVILRKGQRLTVLNRDVDFHRLVRLSGPRTGLGPMLRVNGKTVVTFRKTGVYRLRTRTTENPDMPELTTIGDDNPLPIVVVVR